MLKNYLKLTLRNLRKHKVYSFINIFGLSIGLASSMLMLIFMYSQFSYDRFNEKADRIYRMGREISSVEGDKREPISSAQAAIILKQDFPEVADVVRLKGMGKVIARYDDKQFYEQDMYYADPSVFDVFTFPLIEGNPRTALVKPYSVVITEEMANKYFGNDDPIGKVITLDNQNDFIVSGVIQNLPKRTHIEINMLCSFATLTAQNQPDLLNWTSFNYYTYILLKDGADYKALEAKFPQMIDHYVGRDNKTVQGALSFYLLPLEKIYLYSNLDGNPPGLITEVLYFSLLAIFLTIIACINFINLSTARASVRAKEIGLRKVVGAEKKQIIKQFLYEALIVSFFALAFAFLLVQLFLPVFADKAEVNLTLSLAQTIEIYLGFLVLSVLVGLIAGAYPAFFLAKFQPVKVLKGNQLFSNKKSKLRSSLVVFQFFISAVFICHTFVLDYQQKKLQAIDVGFHKKDVVILPVTDGRVRKSIQTFRSALLENPDIIGVTTTSSLPGLGIHRDVKIPEGYSNTEMQLMDEINVDEDFIPTLGIKLAKGRNFLEANKGDQQNSIIVNELAVQKFGWKDPIGKTIKYSVGQDQYNKGTVVGVVKDFHLSSLHRVIEPLFISDNPDKINHILVRVSPQSINGALEFIKAKWASVFPDHPFQYDFLERKYDLYMKTIGKIIDILSFFAILAVTLACLGIFALAAFISERKTKEIGIRKVLGDTTFGIVFKLNFELLKYVLIASLLIIPYAYFMKDFLSMFLPYMADINYFIYVEALLLVFILALLSISYQAIKAAIANPIESLRYE